MDDDRNWLKNPILPRPPAVPRFSAAELRLVDEDRPSSVMRVAPKKERSMRIETRRQSGTHAVASRNRPTELAPESVAPRRIA